MTLELINPPDLPTPLTYTHVVVATGSTGPASSPRFTIFVVHHRPDYGPVIEEARATLFGEHKPADAVAAITWAGDARSTVARRGDRILTVCSRSLSAIRPTGHWARAPRLDAGPSTWNCRGRSSCCV